MTLVEAIISILIGVVVMGAAWGFYDSAAKSTRKAAGISAATQVAAQFLYALEQDVANLRPQGAPEQTFNTENGDVAGTPGTRRLYFTRRRPEPQFRINFDSWDYTDKGLYGIDVTYEAVYNAKLQVYEITRYVGEDQNPIQRTTFHGAWAKDVRFSRVKLYPPVAPPVGSGQEEGPSFLRVSLLLVGEIDPEKVSDANKAKPVVISTLYAIPTLGPDAEQDLLSMQKTNQ